MSADAWLSTTLGKVAEFGNGGAWNQDEYTTDGIRVVRVSDVKGDRLDLSACKYLSVAALARYERHQLRTGDLIICTVGSHPTQPASVVGRAVVVPKFADGALLNQNAVRIRPAVPHVEAGWLGFLGRSRRFHEYIIGCAGGAASQVRMPIGLLKEMPIDVPPLSTQRRIASILAAYDELIDNNTRRITILEEMSRRIYEEWFVRFCFPGHERVRMVESKLGLVPEGWGFETLADCATVTMGQSPSSEFYNDRGEGLPFHQGVTNFGPHFPTHKMFCSSEGRLAEKGDILVSVRAPVGRINLSPSRMVIGRGLCAVRSRKGQQVFLLHRLFETFKEEDSMGNGAIFKAVSKQEVLGLLFLVPPAGVVNEFEEFAKPIWSLIRNLTFKCDNLRATRDLLLPKLVSGELAVSAMPEAEALAP